MVDSFGNQNIKLAGEYFDKAYDAGVINRRIEEAIQYLDKAIQADSAYVIAYVYRGSFFFHSGQYEKAITDIKKVHELTELNPDDYATDCWLLGESYNGLGQYDTAVMYFNKSIEYDKFLALPFAGRGFSFLKKGYLNAAISDLNKAVEMEPGEPWVYYHRSDYFIAIGEKDLAIADLKKVIESPGSSERNARLAKEKLTMLNENG